MRSLQCINAEPLTESEVKSEVKGEVKRNDVMAPKMALKVAPKMALKVAPKMILKVILK